jgi:hypothetical protein
VERGTQRLSDELKAASSSSQERRSKNHFVKIRFIRVIRVLKWFQADPAHGGRMLDGPPLASASAGRNVKQIHSRSFAAFAFSICSNRPAALIPVELLLGASQRL